MCYITAHYDFFFKLHKLGFFVLFFLLLLFFRSENKRLTFQQLLRLKTTVCKEARGKQGEMKAMPNVWEIQLKTCCPLILALKKILFAPSLSTCAGCQFPPPSSQAGAGLAAVHSPALRNKAASQPPPPPPSPHTHTPTATLQALHHDTVTPLRKWHEDKVGHPAWGTDTLPTFVRLLVDGQVNEVMQSCNCPFAPTHPTTQPHYHGWAHHPFTYFNSTSKHVDSKVLLKCRWACWSYTVHEVYRMADPIF